MYTEKSVSTGYGKLRITMYDSGASEIIPLLSENADGRCKAALEGVESLILALACAGVDVESKAFSVATATAVDSTINHYGD